ncbi:enolase C-terminal domain-like protein [Candidatus Poriferisodalis sp.]|uniref:enolase C-terminal domain-like protein n=1 Tax=Candidatus Poriferisodalis sp. TaxID=3101277 RepID=UPI003B01B7C9
MAFAIEEPLSAGDVDGCAQVARDSRLRVIGDESIRLIEQLTALPEPSRWIVNVRVSKTGGVLRAMEVVAEATKLGIDVIVGCQVGETSVLTRAALAVMASVQGAVIGAEGAFGTHLLSSDLTDRTIMWGHGGLLRGEDVPDRGGGLGLQLDPAAVLVPLEGT